MPLSVVIVWVVFWVTALSAHLADGAYSRVSQDCQARSLSS
jgi:hypothetical protein